jgi:DNA repair protein RadC
MSEHLTIKELPDSEQPYEKFRRKGASSLSDAELLAIIIRTGTCKKKAIDVAYDFLGRGSRSLLNLYTMPYEEMIKIPGIGHIKAIELKCIGELSRRIVTEKYRNEVCLDNAKSVADYYMERMRHERQERLVAIFFDSKCHLQGEKLLTIGSVDSTFVAPRELFIAALNAGAVQLILLHNHPSGIADPSSMDDAATARIYECGRLIGIPLADHIIIGDMTYYSYREHNKLPKKGQLT